MLAPAKDLVIERRPLAGLGDIVDAWRRLAERAAEPNVFYTPDFALAAAPALGHDSRRSSYGPPNGSSSGCCRFACRRGATA